MKKEKDLIVPDGYPEKFSDEQIKEYINNELLNALADTSSIIAPTKFSTLIQLGINELNERS